MNADNMMVSTAIQQTIQQYRHLGLQLPEGMADELTQADAQQDQPPAGADPAALRDAVAAATDAGKDPATDPAVLTELARQQLASLNLGQPVDGRAKWRQSRAEVLHKHMPAILADLARVVEQADTDLAKARKAGVSPADTSPPTMAGQVPLWEQAQEALTRLNRVEQLWGLLVSAFRLAKRPQERRALVLADLNPEQFSDLNGRDALAAARAGHRLALATPDGYTQRCQRIDQHLAQQEARRERERAGKRGLAAA